MYSAVEDLGRRPLVRKTLYIYLHQIFFSLSIFLFFHKVAFSLSLSPFYFTTYPPKHLSYHFDRTSALIGYNNNNNIHKQKWLISIFIFFESSFFSCHVSLWLTHKTSIEPRKTVGLCVLSRMMSWRRQKRKKCGGEKYYTTIEIRKIMEAMLFDIWDIDQPLFGDRMRYDSIR